MAPSVAVETLGLGRRFGATPVFGGLDLLVPEGHVAGIVGRNGAGKTTLLSVLATVLLPSSGSARVLGKDVAAQAEQVRREVGFAPRTDRGYYGRLTLRDNLRVFGSLYGLSGLELRRRVAALIELFDLEPHADRPLQAASNGVRQRCGLARALLHAPPVLLLDEPFHGLDAAGAAALCAVLDEWRGRAGRAVLIAAPRVEDLGFECDVVVDLDPAGRP
jgi:ABC-2 type transport system ATP-binding protein